MRTESLKRWLLLIAVLGLARLPEVVAQTLEETRPPWLEVGSPSVEEHQIEAPPESIPQRLPMSSNEVDFCLPECSTTGEYVAYFRTEYLSLDRDRPRTDYFSVDSDGNPDIVVLGTENLTFDFESAIRLTVGQTHVAEGRSIELAYLSLFDEWESTATVSDNNPFGGLFGSLNATFFTDGGPGASVFDAFRDSGIHVIHNSTELYSVEVNVRKHLNPWPRVSGDVLGGLRVVRVDDDFAFVSFDTRTDEVGSYLISTENTLVGLQFGGDVRYRFGRQATVEIHGKAGLVINFANQRSVLNNSDTENGADLLINTGEINKADLASVIDVGLFGRFPLGPIELHAGYEVIFLGGLALAPEQFDHTIGLTGAKQLDNTGTMLIHGVAAGGSILW